MRRRGWQYALLLILLMLGSASLRTSSCVWADVPPGHSSLRVSSSAASVPARVDFDADRVEDALAFTAGGDHPDVEIYLSFTQTVLVLPVDSAAAVAGSLAVRDLDSDGDADLLWQGEQVLAPAE